MKKKLKDLTDEEIVLICKKYHDCVRESGKPTCPLWYGSICLRGFIEQLRYVNNEVDL